MFGTAHTMTGWIALGMSCQKQGAPSFRDMIEKAVVGELQLHNGSFETVKSWSFEKGRIESNPFFSPVDGLQYAALPAGASLSQTLTGSSNPETIYTVTVYARSINERGNDAHSEIAVSVRGGDRVLESVSVDLSVSRLRGAAGKYYSDDGANVWIDKGIRHQFNDRHFYQSVRLDPLTDPWKVYEDTVYYDEEPYLGFALGAVAFDNKRYLYGTVYSDDDEEVPYSSIRLSKGRVEDSQYEWTSSETVLENSACSRALDQEGEMYSNCEFPWVIDAHSYFDASERRLWLSWGGGGVWVTELDPQTGHILGKPESKEVLEHSPRTHTKVISFDGDEYSSRWVEGSALWKQGSFWYLFASYGALNRDYTIRIGRGTSPQGPFYSKEGIPLHDTSSKGRHGSTILLGHEGMQAVPGHPHIWQEGEQTYMGYDYRERPDEEKDWMGIRRISWVDGWPTIYVPITLSFSVAEYQADSLLLQIDSVGEEGSMVAVDVVTLSKM